MTVPFLFALIGGVILVGFLANLLFRLTKVPSVLLLVGVGVLLGPVTGWIRSDTLLPIAPFFGSVALLVILFEGGLELELAHVIRHAPRTALLAVGVFVLSLAAVAYVACAFLGFSVLNAIMLGAILGATSPAICIPVVSGLSLRTDVKTVIKLESVMGEVLLIVSVVLLMESHATGATDASGWVWAFVRSLLVAFLVASIAGVLWSRLVGWMGREPLSYMLTLGMVCLLYFAVEELGGSPSIATLLFGLILANMQSIAGRFGPRFRELFGIDIREEQFVLSQFMVNITAELSFLVRTFFFVYLGLLLDFSALSWTVAIWTSGMFGLLLAARQLGVWLFTRGSRFSEAESQTIMALQPRGLATAVVAFLPMQAGIGGTALFPLYAFIVIILSNVYMTAGVLFAERRLRKSAPVPPAPELHDTISESDWAPTEQEVMASAGEPGDVVAPSWRAAQFSPAGDFADEPAPATFTDWMARLFGLRLEDREAEYVEMIRASYLSEPLFWVQTFLGAAICALGLILDQVAIVIGGALILPLVRPVIATGLALASGDIYLLVKLLVKLLGFAVVVVVLSAALVDVLPFGVATGEIAARTRPTILDFLVALFGGMSGAALISLRRRAFHYLPGAVIAITLLPTLCVMGFGLGDSGGGTVLRGGALQFTANLFAAVLGAGAILVLVGIPQAAQCASVRRWKADELERPLVRAVFGRLRLQHVIGRTGSVRARVTVVGLFLLALLIPLQGALNQLTLEYRVRQAVSRAQVVFDVPHRSTVISTALTVADADVYVRIQVATNELFTAQDIAHFEERVSDQAGCAVRLDLVQSVSGIGGADTLRGLLAGRAPVPTPAPVRHVSESLRDVGSVVAMILRSLPLPEDLRVLTVRGSLVGSGAPVLDVVYLAGGELGADAVAMLRRLLAAQTLIGDDQIALRWVPADRTVRISRAGAIDQRDLPALRELHTTLNEHPDVGLTLELPPGISEAAKNVARQRVEQAVGETALSVLDAPAQARPGIAMLRLVARQGGLSP